MGIVCEFDLVSTDLPLARVAAGLGTVLNVEEVLSGTHGLPAIVFSTTGVDPAAIEARLDDDPTVADHVALETEAGQSQYRTAIEDVDTDVYTHLVDLRSHPVGATVTAHGWTVRARFADRSDLDAFRQVCRDTEIGFRPRRVFESNPEPSDDYGLTAPQHEALLVAYRMGYFDVPRDADLSAVAEELDTTTSALSERLRRGQRRLVGRTIADSA